MTALWAEIATSSASLISQGASLSPFSTASKDRAGGLVRGAEVLSRGSCLFSTPQARGEVGFWWSPGPLNAADTPFPWSDLAGAGLPLDLGLKSLLKEAIALPILPIPSRWGWAPSAAPTPFHSHPAAAAKSLQSCSTL